MSMNPAPIPAPIPASPPASASNSTAEANRRAESYYLCFKRGSSVTETANLLAETLMQENSSVSSSKPKRQRRFSTIGSTRVEPSQTLLQKKRAREAREAGVGRRALNRSKKGSLSARAKLETVPRHHHSSASQPTSLPSLKE